MDKLIAFNEESIKIKKDYEKNIQFCPKCKNEMMLKGDCEEPMCYYSCNCGYMTEPFYV